MQSLNISSFFPNQLGRSADAVERSQEKLSTGLRINHSWDDAAGQSIAEGLRSQVSGTQQAMRNIQDANNIIKIAEDGVYGTMPILQRMRELVVQASNGTNTDKERNVIQAEIDEIKPLIAQAFQTAQTFRIAFDGTDNADRILNFQVGPNPGDLVEVDFNPLREKLSGVILDAFGYEELFNSEFHDLLIGRFGNPPPDPNLPLPAIPGSPFTPGSTLAELFPKKLTVVPGTEANFTQAFATLDNAQTVLMDEVTKFGAISNRLMHTFDQLANFELNIASSESQIRDVDMAKEIAEMTKGQVMQQSAQAMLAQANARPFQILELLKQG